ncbi:hypothetical protein K1719_045333 [Acacia pycnantha]|nr:hypothetical protein K1719_045333 [Acacia pycnantha]
MFEFLHFPPASSLLSKTLIIPFPALTLLPNLSSLLLRAFPDSSVFPLSLRDKACEAYCFLSLFLEIALRGAERTGLEEVIPPRDWYHCAQGQNTQQADV